MALEYKFYLNSKISVSEVLDKYFSEEKIEMNNCSDNPNFYDCYSSSGFSIMIRNLNSLIFDYAEIESEFFEIEFKPCCELVFRLDKFYDNSISKLNMITICDNILSLISSDAILLFNGELVVLKRIDGIFSINRNFGFWNTTELENYAKILDQNFNVS
jgi:hypothetical protein